tara:strand:+ start:1020 stop:2090 length:1071 start_codon:yes stop_codon:yes gene_type:complete
MNKKILFLVNGLGLGNSTRCYAIIQSLIKNKCEVSIITSGNGKWFFQDKKEIKKLYTIEAINYGSKNNKINIFETLKNIPKILKIIKQNSDKIYKIIDDYKPNVIITDSVYLSLKIKKFRIPIVAINNSDIVLEKFNIFEDKPKSIYPQLYCIEKLDYLYHRFIPNRVISPDLIYEKSKSNVKNFNRISPIIRTGINQNLRNSVLIGGVMLSGSNFGIKVNLKKDYENLDLEIIGRDEPENWQQKKNINFHGRVKNNIDLLNKIDFCVVNGGYSAICELFWARIPMIVVPVPNHAEQWVNAKQIENSGCGFISDEKNYEDSIPRLIRNYNDIKKNFEKYSTHENGADEAAEIIIKT